MTVPTGRWSLAARLARRQVRRHPWRHLLVVALIFVPVLAAFLTFSALHTWQQVARHRNAFEFLGRSGSFDPEADATARSPEADAALRARLPRGSIVETHWEGAEWLVTGHPSPHDRGPELTGTRLLEAPQGTRASVRFVVRGGRLPSSATEIAISERLAEAGGWRIGDVVASARTAKRFRVVGIADLGDALQSRAAALGPQPRSFWVRPATGHRVSIGANQWTTERSAPHTSIWLPPGSDPSTIDAVDAYADPAQETLDSRVNPSITFVSAAMAALVAVVASAAFAISSRRQLRTVGLLASAGADPSTIRAALVLEGAIPGLVAGVAAVIVGVTAVLVVNARGWVERLWDVDGAHATASLPGAALAVALGLAAGVVAAWQPARAAAKVPVLAALAGRRPLGPVRTRVPLAGIAAWAGGALLLVIGTRGFRSGQVIGGGIIERMMPFLLIGGVVAIAAGGVGLAPAAVAIVGKLAVHTSGSVRLALRGIARHRTQSAATVAAIGVALAIPVGAVTARVADAAQHREQSAAQPPAPNRPSRVLHLERNPRNARVKIDGALRSPEAVTTSAAVRTILGPSAVLVQTTLVPSGPTSYRQVAAIDEADAADLIAPWAARALREGRAISLDNRPEPVVLISGGKTVRFEIAEPPPMPTGSGTFGPPTRILFAQTDAELLVGTHALHGVGTGRPPSSLVYLRPTTLARAEADRLNRLNLAQTPSSQERTPTLDEARHPPAAASQEAGADVWVTPYPSTGDFRSLILPGQESWRSRMNRHGFEAATVLAALLAIVVVTISLSLRTVDTGPEQRAALAAGAPPATMRRQRAIEGTVLAALGGLLALPLGWIPVTALRTGIQLSNRLPSPGNSFDQVFAPGLEVVPILLAPAVLAGLAWWLVPTVAAHVRRPQDLVTDTW